MAGGGGSGGLGSFLPMALAIGATIATDGAAAPMLGEAMGAEAGTLGATMLGAGAMGAGTGALGGIMQGQSAGDVFKNSLISGALGAGTAGILGGLSGGPTPDALVPSSSGTEMNAMVNPSLGNNGITLPPTPDVPPLSSSGFEPTPNPVPSLNSGLPTPNPSITTPFGTSSLGSGISSGVPSAIPEAVSAGPGSFLDKSYIPSKMAGSAIAAAPSLLSGNLFAQPTLNTAQAANPVTSGLDYKFDRNTYQPSVAPNYNGIAGLDTGPRAQRLMGYGYGNPRTQSLSGYGYADGGSIGTVEEMSRENATGGNQMFPQSGLGGLTGANTYQNATNTPTSSNLMEPTDAVTDPYTGAMKFKTGGKTPRTLTANTQQNTSLNLPEVKKHMAATRTPEGLKAVSTAAQGGDYNAQFALNQMQGSPVQGIDAASQMPATVQAAQGGIMSGTIGSYSDGGQMLKGPGDGMSDSIPAKIGKHQPARLADSEFVIPADVVSHLGNGSSDAGAKQLYAMMDRIRKARTGTKKQGKQIKPEKYMPA